MSLARKIYVVVVGLGLAGAIIVIGRPLARLFRPLPTINQVNSLIRSEQYDEAESRLRDLLWADAGNFEARMLLAHVLLERPDPKPDELLVEISRIHTSDPSRRARLLVYEGRARYALKRYDLAEAAWLDALSHDPLVPEAPWLLVDLYYIEGRLDEIRELALRQYAAEPDPVDRVRFLVEMIRPEVNVLSSGGIIHDLGPIVAANPDDVRTSVALGRALAREGQVDAGLKMLRSLVKSHPADVACWDALLEGLGNAGDLDGLAEAIDAVPAELRSNPRMAFHRGRLALDRGDRPRAIKELEQVVQRRPSDRRALFRLESALKGVDQAKGEEVSRQRARLEELQRDQKTAYDEADGLISRGRLPSTDLCHHIANLREELGHPDEAIAWHRLVLIDRPDDAVSLAALARLEGGQ